MGKWGDGSLYGRRKGKVMGEGAERGWLQEVGWLQGGLIAWEKKGGSDGQVGERKEEKKKERKMGWAVALGFGLGQ